MDDDFFELTRRRLLTRTGVAALSGAFGALVGACSRSPAAVANEQKTLRLPPLLDKTEKEENEVEPALPQKERVGFAVVGLGRLALQQLLPAFGASKRCRLTAVVSGNRGKAMTVAGQYGLPEGRVYDYASFDRIEGAKDVEVVLIALPNGLHAEYTVRAAQAGKHVLCEKPMAPTVADCDRMIDACRIADRKLMIAYRLQYEPFNREVIRLSRGGELGRLKGLVATNGQAQGDPKQWRLVRSLAGGGSLVDVGVYCVNAARYVTGEEPISACGFVHSTAGDERFREVEEQVDFLLRFPSGFVLTGTTSYGVHNTKGYRVLGAEGWAELDPAFSYSGQVLRVAREQRGAGTEAIEQRRIQPKNHFALEMDHMARCVRENIRPHTPGEEGRADVSIMTAIYESARSERTVALPEQKGRDAFRGAPPV
jgi:predicted dehydrogenase